MIISFYLNGVLTEHDVTPHRRAVDYLRDDCGCRSLHHECADGTCGACLILMDDRPALSCILPAFELRFREVWTMEGLSDRDEFTDIVSGFKEARVRLCSSCAPARALAVEALLRQTVRPSARQIRETVESVQCACCSRRRLHDAVIRSARNRERRIHG